MIKHFIRIQERGERMRKKYFSIAHFSPNLMKNTSLQYKFRKYQAGKVKQFQVNKSRLNMLPVDLHYKAVRVSQAEGNYIKWKMRFIGRNEDTKYDKYVRLYSFC